MTNTVVLPGEADAAVLRLRGTDRGIALTTDCNGRYCYLDPYAGGAIAVAEAARNVVCTGAEPVAVTDCLNFGNPEKPDVYYQLERAISGMAEACRVLGTPVISGNVSLYNETNGEAVYPTPVAGMLGVLDDVRYRLQAGFRNVGDPVYLLGSEAAGGALAGDAHSLGASEYLALVHGRVQGRPRIDLDRERRLQRACLAMARAGLLESAHDCSDGGLAVALAECCITGNLGLDASGLALTGRRDGVLFGEEQSRIIVSVRPDAEPQVLELAAAHDVAATRLGTAGGDRLRLARLLDVPVADLARAHARGLPEALGWTGD
jgi:phosphoribosylformylglycinamidine synthase